MTLKQIHKATLLFAEVEKLDKLIIAIEKLAVKLSSNNVKSAKFGLYVDFENNTDTGRVLDEDGSLKTQRTGHPIPEMYRLFLTGMEVSKPKPPEFEIKQDLSDTELFLILDVLLRSKQEDRKSILSQIKLLSLTCS